MFNQRQLEIIIELCENQGNYMTASYFVQKQQVSLRTIQGDMKAIKTELAKQTCVEFQSLAPKGSRIMVLDPEAFGAWKEQLYQQFGGAAMNEQEERVNQIILMLLRMRRAVSLYDVETTFFISRSTLVNDLKRGAKVLKKHGLELMRGANKVFIDGTEINKRLCISEENLLAAGASSPFTDQDGHHLMSEIKNILVETFVKFRRNVSEVELNNTILLLYVALWRMEQQFYIDPTELEIMSGLTVEREIAQAVCQRLSAEFHLRIPDTEVDYLALYLKSKENYSYSSVITPEIDEMVLGGLREIHEHLGINLTNDLVLRIALGLHCIPLAMRIRYDMQLKNHLVDYIRQTFPQGFDMATYFAAFLQKQFHKEVRNEEIAFIAIHLYKALTDIQIRTGTKRVLVISSLRRSENILLRQTLSNWFEGQIAEITFLQPSEMDENFLDQYDTFVTTEKNSYYDMGLAIYINQFPDQQDYLNLKLAIDGFESINDILQIFSRDLFEVFHQDMDRDEILTLLCNKSSRLYQLEGLLDAVMDREKLRSTFFGNNIAAAHPIFPVSPTTFVSIGVCPKSVKWDSDGNQVNLVMVVNVGKNNSKAFQLWNYLSKIFADQYFVERLLADPSYEKFLKLLKDAIADNFKG